MRWCNWGEALSASVQRKARQRKLATTARSLLLLLIGGEFLSGREVAQHLFARSLRRFVRLLLFVTPQMKRVGEHDVTHQSFRVVVGEIERRINLKVRRDVPGESNGGGVFPAALEIDLDAPLLIKIVSVTENRFVFVTGVDGADDDFVMLSVVAGFDVRLRIDIQMRRPIHKAGRKEIRFRSEQSEFCPENPIVRLKTAKHRYFGPFCQTHLGL